MKSFIRNMKTESNIYKILIKLISSLPVFKDKNKILPKSDYVESIKPASIYIEKIRKLISDSQKPIMLIGSQAMKNPEQMESLSEAVKILISHSFLFQS
mgnify:CR=1 FL=1